MGGFLGVGVGGGGGGSFLADSAEAEDEKQEAGERRRYSAGDRGEDLRGAVVRRRRGRGEEASRGHSGHSFIGIIGSSLLSS